MNVSATELPGVLVIEPKVFGDERGFFYESFNARDFAQASGLQLQLAKLKKDQPSNDGDFMVPTGKIPAVGVEYVRSMRNVKYYETIFELLAKQFELAKIDEAKDSSLIQLLDKAIPAEHKSKPKRALIVLAGVFGGGMLGIILAFMHAAYRGSRKNPESNYRWQQLSMAWKGVPRK